MGRRDIQHVSIRDEFCASNFELDIKVGNLTNQIKRPAPLLKVEYWVDGDPHYIEVSIDDLLSYLKKAKYKDGFGKIKG